MNTNANLLSRLYKVTYHKYLKLSSRLKRNVKTGRFKQFTRHEKNKIFHKLEKLRSRLQQLNLQLKLGVAAGAVTFLLTANEAKSQTIGPFFQKQRSENPVRAPLLGLSMYPAAVDLDNDGDKDIVVGLPNGAIRYFQNDGTPEKPVFNEETVNNPFDVVNLANGGSSPAFADIDGDSDQDLFVGGNSGLIYYFRNDEGVFSEQTGPWDDATKEGNPFDGFATGGNTVKISMSDIDVDGDVDLMMGGKYGADFLVMLENDGLGNFTRNDKFDGVSSTYPEATAFADVDTDGDMDLFFGATSGFTGFIHFYRQDPDGAFIEETGTWDGTTGNPFGDFGFPDYAAPLLVDLDNDGDLDAIVGRNFSSGSSKYENSLAYLENTGNFNFVMKDGLENPFDGVLAGNINSNVRYSSPAFLDVDNDGDLDMVLGSKYSNDLRYFQYDSDKQTFIEQFDTANPFVGFTFSFQVIPRAADFDQDGYDDLFIGAYSTKVYLHNNQDGTFSQMANAVTDAIVYSYPSIALLDVDSDGDRDSFVGIGGSNGFKFYRNTDGTYVEETAPFPFSDPAALGNQQTKPAAGDLNFDGIPDLVIGMSNGDIRAFLNTGADSFGELTDVNYPFPDISTASDTSPILIDYDKDGDTDMFVGDYKGVIHYLRNENPAPIIDLQAVAPPIPDQPINVFPNLNLSDPDGDYIRKAVITIDNFTPTNEILALSDDLPAGITAQYNPDTGVLTLSGEATVAEYQAAFRLITYENEVGAFPGGRSLSETISMQVFDWDGTISAASVASLSHTNDLPMVTPSVSSIKFFAGALTVDGAAIVSDADDNTFTSAQIKILNYNSAEDILTASGLPSTITATFIPATGIMVLTGTDTKANYEAAIRLVRYQNSASIPSTTPRTIEFTVNDGESNSAVQSINIIFNQAPVITRSQTSSTFVTTPVVIDNGITLTDDGTNIVSAVISILGGFLSTEDQLQFTDQNGITGSYNASSGVLTLTGSAQVSDYQTALRSITYNNTSSSPNITARTIELKVNDGFLNSNAETLNVVFAPPIPPALASTVSSVNYVSGQLIINSAITVSDTDNINLQSATITISSGLISSEDVLAFTASGGITGNYNSSAGTLSLSGSSTLANYETVLRSVTYQNTNPGDRNKATRTITFVVNDGGLNSNALSSSVVIPNQLPAVINPTTPPLYGSNPILFADLLTLNDNDNATLQSATIAITSGLKAAEDQLLFTDQSGITGSYTTASGTLQLAGSSSIANYQTAIRSIQYQNNASSPDPSPRIISISVNDGISSSTVSPVTININRPPVITPEQPIVEAGGEISLNLSGIVSDPDNNLDLANINSITIVSQPESGAIATVENMAIKIKYNLVPNFTGIDRLTVGICDNLNRCATEVITIQVGAELEVYNAVSANGDGLNDFLYLRYINPDNKVTIYNRWGDKVSVIENYNNNVSAKRFEGFNENGNELPSGTYFYKIEYSGAVLTTGYLSLKR